MNKTISINISGFVFNIEEQAYEHLKQYLDKIRNNFNNEDERDEIMADIELRIAELFQEKIAPNKEVVVEEDIVQIQDILGLPEDFASDDEENYQNEKTEKSSHDQNQTVKSKRLFRDTDNGTFAGICSGLGYYFDVDRVVFRIIFVLLFILFGTGVLLYIILWLVVPEAKTTSDKIEMKGGAVNVGSIKEHVSNIKQTITDKRNASNVSEKVRGVVDKGVVVGLTVFQAVSKVFGVGFTIGGIFMFVFLMIIMFGNTGIIPFMGPDRIDGIPQLIEIIYPGQEPSSLIFISLVLVLTIPLIALVTLGVRILFNYRQNIKIVAWTFAIVWSVAVGVLFVYSTQLASNFKSDKEIRYSMPLENAGSDELIISVMEDDQFSNHLDPYDDWGASELVKVDEDFIYFGLPQLKVIAVKDTGDFRVSIIKESHGATTRDAINNIERIDYPIISKDNKLFLSPYLKMPREDKLRAQYVRVEILVPRGKIVKFGKNIDRVLRHLDDEPIPYANHYEGTEWISLRTNFYQKGSRDYNLYETIVDISEKASEEEPDEQEED
ncbi:MAG: phage shock protein PspC (stress-responsive transcriptional regulator) [Crocinitomix sp.]|jgi:phage shock protein PspC (stress-responsive transcriptional regulator)